MSATAVSASPSSLTWPSDDPFQWDDTNEYLHNSLVGDASREREFHKCISNVRDYGSLQTNWDTYGGLPASEPAIAFSTDLLGKLLRNPDVPPPYVSPISTGVYVAWVFRDMKLYFEADDESVLFVAERSGHTIIEGEDPCFDAVQAAQLVESFFDNAL